MLMAWAQRTGPEFAHGVLQLCDALYWPSDFGSNLMGCMGFETGETFSPAVRNKAGSGATGLIQFMDETAEELGTTCDALAAMTAIEQLDYVRRYFAPYARRIHCLADMYMAILLPKYIGTPGNTVLFSGGVAYRENSGLDENTDGIITKDEAADLVRKKYARGWLPGNMANV